MMPIRTQRLANPKTKYKIVSIRTPKKSVLEEKAEYASA
jgi:hypothetical protein